VINEGECQRAPRDAISFQSKDGPGRDHSNAPSRPGRSSISPLPADPGRMQPGPSPSLTAQPPRNVSGLYHELLYAVARKFPFESRHETALRYIREAEERAGQTGSSKQNAEVSG